MSLKRVKEKYEEDLLRVKGVRGVGFNSSIIVYVDKLTPKLAGFLPKKLDGVEVKVIETGRIPLLSMRYPIPVARAIYGVRTDRYRPVPGGVSCGHPEVTAGTHTCRAIDNKTRRFVGLSNNHVIALDWGSLHLGKKGDSVLQPGPVDGGRDPIDKVGELERWIPVKLGEDNSIDAGIYNSGVLKEGVYEIGSPDNTIEPRVGMKVVKSGRTTGVTYSRIIDVDASLFIDGWGECLFRNQIVVQPSFMSPGDSGSWAGEIDSFKSVGLGFAGSPQVSVLNRASIVEKLLDISIVPPLPTINPWSLTIPFGFVSLIEGLVLGGKF